MVVFYLGKAFFGKGGVPLTIDFRDTERHRSRKERKRLRCERRKADRLRRCYIRLVNVRCCRYLDNCKKCDVAQFGFCGRDGLQCVQRDKLGNFYVYGDFWFNPFDALLSADFSFGLLGGGISG
jgi:hypothetical protein